MLGKDIYYKKIGYSKSKDPIEYNYKSFRHFPTMNFNYKDFDYKFNYKNETNPQSPIPKNDYKYY